MPPVSNRRRFRRFALTIGVLVTVLTTLVVVMAVTSAPVGRDSARTAGTDPSGVAPQPADPGRPAGRNQAAAPVPRSPAHTHCPCPNLSPGSAPTALPGPVLIADHLNNRLLVVDPNGAIAWTFPRPGDLDPGQTFQVPDDAFFTPDGKDIVVTQEDDFVVSVVSVADHRIVWRYGTPGVPGSGPNQLWNPDDALKLPDGNIIVADIKNCRIVVLRQGRPQPLRVFGTTTTGCWHEPPQHWGSPNGAFPMATGDFLVTEINGDWVDALSPGGQVRFSVHPPGVNYPSDTNEVRPGVYLTSDYSSPGQIVEFNQAGQLLWRFPPSGADALDKPSLALPLPNGDVLCNDDFNHRVIVIDPRTNRIVWQYGHTGVAGARPGYLNDPDGVDLSPPLSLMVVHAASAGAP